MLDYYNAMKWINALRSGRYPQGQMALNTDNSAFCCLGVLCEVAIDNGVDIMKNRNLTEGVYIAYEDNTIIPPRSVETWLCGRELNNNEHIDLGHLFDEFIAMNDRGDSFREIANKIEAEIVEHAPQLQMAA